MRIPFAKLKLEYLPRSTSDASASLRERGPARNLADGFDRPPSAQQRISAWKKRRRDPLEELDAGARRPTYIALDHEALTRNVQRVREQVGPRTEICAVVKARAYGHGAVEVAHVALGAGADRLAVATVSEGLELRGAGITAPILVLGALGPGEAGVVVRESLTATVTNMHTAHALAAEAKRQRKVTPVHLKVNTGLNRLGFAPDDVPAVLSRLNSGVGLSSAARATKNWLDVEGIFTHLHSAQHDPAATRTQISLFSRLLERLEERGLRPRVAHADNSWGTELYPEAHFDMVRPGKSLYGLTAQTEPVLSWHTGVTHVQKVKANETVGYGGEFRPAVDSRIAVLPVGHADGASGIKQVLIQGKSAPVVSIAMDQMMVDVTGIRKGLGQRVGVSEPVVLLGEQRGARITPETVQEDAGLHALSQVTTRITPRSPSRTAHQVETVEWNGAADSLRRK